MENLKRQKLSITVPFQTWQAKSLLAKAKLLPQITYTARTYPLDNRTQQIIETEFLNYLTNNSAIQLCIKNLQRPTIAGGIKYPNPTIYCDLFYISHLFEYFKARKYDLPFNANTYLIEYEIGLVLSKTYGGGRVVSASGSETSVSGSTSASAIIYDAHTSIKKKKNFKNSITSHIVITSLHITNNPDESLPNTKLPWKNYKLEKSNQFTNDYPSPITTGQNTIK